MKIVIEAQHAVALDKPRGVGYYSIQLINTLLKRNKNDYSICFFDIRRENGNRLRAEKLFGQKALGRDIPFHECNEVDYRALIRDESLYNIKNYNEYTKSRGDIYHYTNFITIPTKINGKILATVHDLNWIPYSGGASSVIRELGKISLERLKRAQPNVIVVSSSAKKEVLEYTDIPEEKINIAYLSYDEENIFPDQENIRKIKPFFEMNFDYLFFIGTFERKKNIVRIVEAFNQIAGKFNGLRLILAGQPTWDDPSSIYETIKKSPFTERIIMLGYITTDEKRLLYSNALGLIFPSICEGFGIPVLEAMVCGCPVITADNSSLPEVGGEAVIYVNALKTEQLAFEMERLVSFESLRSELREKGLVQAKKFSWAKTAEIIESVYNNID
jgi:glycosyltransferase involved in cell wall biosynthesis